MECHILRRYPLIVPNTIEWPESGGETVEYPNPYRNTVKSCCAAIAEPWDRASPMSERA